MTTLPCTIERIVTRKDNTCAVTIGTQELPPSKAGDLFALLNKYCYVAIKSETFRPNELADLDALKAEYDSGKTPAQRLRGVLYKLFEQDAEGFTDFNMYYAHQMERILNHFKNKIDE